LDLPFISEHTIGLERSVGRSVTVKRQWRLVYRTDKRRMPAATAFVSFMDSEGSRLMRHRSASTRRQVNYDEGSS
jgi:hypothetical protein